MQSTCDSVIDRLVSEDRFRKRFEENPAECLEHLALSPQERADLLALDVSSLPTLQGTRRKATTVCAMKGGLGE